MEKSNSKIVDDEEYIKICNDLEHNPPMHIVIRPGKKLIHTCPKCGKTTIIKGQQILYGKS